MPPPPPINWHTKPKVCRQGSQDSTSLDTSQRSSVASDGLLTIYISPARLRDIEAALQHLRLPPLLDLGNNSYQDNIDHPTLPRFEQLDNPASPRPEYRRAATPIGHSFSPRDSSDCLDLSASFSRLTTSTSSPQALSALFQSTSNLSPRKNSKKYYVIVVGKCTGVFWDEWDNVLPLVNGVSGARYKSFPTHEQATAFYLDAKKKHLVNIVRDPGDDELFGPL